MTLIIIQYLFKIRLANRDSSQFIFRAFTKHYLVLDMLTNVTTSVIVTKSLLKVVNVYINYIN